MPITARALQAVTDPGTGTVWSIQREEEGMSETRHPIQNARQSALNHPEKGGRGQVGDPDCRDAQLQWIIYVPLLPGAYTAGQLVVQQQFLQALGVATVTAMVVILLSIGCRLVKWLQRGS